MSDFAQCQKLAIRTEGHASSSFYSLARRPSLIVRGLAPIVGGRGQWRGASGGIADAIPALILCGSRGASIDGGRGIDRIRGGSRAKEALRDIVLLIDVGDNGCSTGGECEGGGQGIEGIGRGSRGSNDLAEG